jgi:hypothetical protein
MPPKKSSTKTKTTAPQRPRARKRSTTEPQPVATEPQPVAPEPQHVAPPHPSPRWFTPVAIVLAVALLIGVVLEINPLDLAAAEERLARMEAVVDSTGTSGGGLHAEVASAERVARACREGLRSMVRMWNQYVRELKAAEASPQRFRAARRRFDRAQKQASLAVRRCEHA